MSATASYAITDAAAVKVAENPGPQPMTFVISVEADGPVTIGDAAVVAGGGVTLTAAMAPMTVVLNGDHLYAICATSITATVNVLAFVSGLNT